MPQIITLVNAKITDGPTRGGGNPTVQQPPPPEPEPPAAKPPEPEPPKPVPPVVKQPDPPKVVETVKPREPEVVVPKVVVKPEVKPKVDLTPVTTATVKPTPKPAVAKPKPAEFKLTPATRTESQTKPQPTKPDNSAKLASALADNRRSVSDSIRKNTSSSTSVEMPGPGGEAFVNYSHLVGAIYQRAYDQALTTAGEIGDRDDSVDVAVTIAKDGRIVSSRITRNSGNPALNKLVKGVLDRVDSVPNFPSGARDAQRTFNITFDLKSRRLTG